LSQPETDLVKIGLHIGALQAGDATTNRWSEEKHHLRRLRLQGIKQKPRLTLPRRAHEPTNAVSMHSRPVSRRHCEADMHRTRGVPQENKTAAVSAVDPSSATHDFAERPMPSEGVGSHCLSFVADSQFLATTCPTSGKNFSPGLGGHSLAEAVGVLSLPFVRLEGTLHVVNPFVVES
jgi:hypothetical protein